MTTYTSLFTPQDAECAEIIEISTDARYALLVTVRNASTNDETNTIMWIDDNGFWHSDHVTWWLCELQSDGCYHAFERTVNEALAYDLWTLYSHSTRTLFDRIAKLVA